MMNEIDYYIVIYDKFSLDYQEVILNPSILRHLDMASHTLED